MLLEGSPESVTERTANNLRLGRFRSRLVERGSRVVDPHDELWDDLVELERFALVARRGDEWWFAHELD